MPSLTITTTALQAQRLIIALGDYQQLGRTATQEEVKALLIGTLRTIVINYEQRVLDAAAKVAIIPPSSFDPT